MAPRQQELTEEPAEGDLEKMMNFLNVFESEPAEGKARSDRGKNKGGLPPPRTPRYRAEKISMASLQG